VSQPAPYAEQPGEIGTLDRVVTVMLLVCLAVLAPVAGFMGLLTAMASDGCGSATACNDTMIGVGVFTSAGAPIVVALVALVWVIVRWVRGRSTWWIPFVAVLVGAAGWAIGAFITFSAVG
jgi:hypothetical protein